MTQQFVILSPFFIIPSLCQEYTKFMEKYLEFTASSPIGSMTTQYFFEKGLNVNFDIQAYKINPLKHIASYKICKAKNSINFLNLSSFKFATEKFCLSKCVLRIQKQKSKA